MRCDSCRFRSPLGVGRINCHNQNAAPRTESYAGSGAHPLNFDPDIVVTCDGWEEDPASYFSPVETAPAPISARIDQ